MAESIWDSRTSSSVSPPTATPGTPSGEQGEVDNTVTNEYLSFLQQSGSARPPSVLPLVGLRTDVEAGADMTLPQPPTLPTSGVAGGNDLAPTLWGPPIHKNRPLPMWEGARPKTPQQPLGLLERVGLAATMPGMTAVRTDPLGVTEVTFKSGPPTSGHPDEVGNSGMGLNQNVVDDHHLTPFLENVPRAALPTRTSRHCPARVCTPAAPPEGST